MKSNAFISSPTRTRIVVNCGLLIAISIVLKILFEVYIPLGGFPSLRLNITALPIMLSGILLGPFAGFAVGIISDLMCFIIKPGGPFFIGFTVASGLTGFIPGLLFMLLRKKKTKYLEWFNLVFVALSGTILAIFGVFSFSNGSVYYAGEPLNMVFFIIFIALMIAFAVFPIIVVKKSNLDSEYRSDHILFIVSVSQMVTSILLNTWFLSILYGQAVAVLLPARLITNIFLIPLYTIILVGLLKTLPGFLKQH
ncbi:folate family ECF transporter S component [Acetobacterium paludosum]|uniref:Folate family ECF transporter S component n=1 Tax=Acetobacterium paludosum TaxID=52693 RepID=A0A923HUZ6_9FIRM|nr:folate family ECF transporter S component [Acetobacterium paludosum]MBC3887079.1 folate family ECF transporter S component [Acetobacterium paludosum]